MPPTTSSIRNAYTPTITSTAATASRSNRFLNLGTTSSTNGMSPPTIHSSQNSACQLPPGRMVFSAARSRGTLPQRIVM